jgi:hypothetical protein
VRVPPQIVYIHLDLLPPFSLSTSSHSFSACSCSVVPGEQSFVPFSPTRSGRSCSWPLNNMWSLNSLVCLTFALRLVQAAPLPDGSSASESESSSRQLGVYFPSAGELPVLNLPYASYRAKSYDAANDVRDYVRTNTRY